MKKTYDITAGGQKLKLRLTRKGLKAIREELGKDPRSALVGAIGDPVDLAPILAAALSWKGNENPITDGEELYDLLVDEGYNGSDGFRELVFGLGTASGIWSAEEAQQLAASLKRAERAALEVIDGLSPSGATPPTAGK